METVVSILIPAIVENVFGALTEAVGLSDWLRQRLGRDPEKLAFQQALTQALTDSATHYPGRDLRYFAEILRDIGGPLLARTLQPAATLLTADELTNIWLNHLTVDSLIHYRAEFTQFAIHFLDRLQFHLKNQQPLRWIIQARHERNSEEIMRRTADAAEQSATSIKALQQEVARLTTTLVTVLQTGSSSTVITEGGAYIGANVSAQNFAGRDLTIKNYFVTGLPHLVIDYSSRIQDFLLEYLGSKRKKVPFGGRQQQLAELNAWLDDSAAPPYYLMTAEAGRGKSALVCRWLAQLTTRADFDVIFVPISIRFETATQDVVFAALAARLANLYESEPEKLPSASLTAEQWKGVCQSYLRREPPTGKQLVVILDGLDESTGWTPTRSLFSADPPNRLRVLVTARTRPRENETNGWANILGWDNPQLAHTATLPGLERRGVEEALASMGNPLNKLVTKVDVVGELHRLSEGDPLLIRLYVDAVLAQSEAINTLRAEDLHSIQPGLAGYFERWWQDQQEQWRIQGRDPLVEQANLRHLLNAIAAALGPLTLEDLAALDSDLTDSMLVRRLLYQVSRWLVGDGKTQGYSYSHPRLGYYFWEKLSNHEQRMWDKRFCKWGKQTQDDLNTGTLVPDYAPHYLLKHYAIHLERAEAPPMDFYALISNGWRQAWAKMDYRITGFLTDVDRAWKQAKHAYSPMKQGCSIHITQQIKAALCRSSGIALDNKLPPELLLRAVQLALYTPIEALATVKLHIDDQKRTDMLAMLAPYLPQDLYSEALVIVKEIKNESMRATILTAFAPYLPNFLLNEVLLLVGEIREQAKHASVLMALAPHLSESMIYQTLEVIKRIEDEATRITALSTFTPYLSKPLLADALTIIKETEDKNLCITALSTLAPHLPNSLLPDALLLIRDIRDESLRVTALSTFAPRFSQPLIAIALELIQKIKDNSLRINALSVLAPYLSESLQLEALSIARGIEDETKSITALATLSPYLPDPVRISVLDEVIASINNIEEDTNYFDRLIALIRDALAVAKKIGNVDKDTTILTIALKQVVDCIRTHLDF